MGKYDKITTQFSRLIINSIKKDIRKSTVVFDFETTDGEFEIIELRYKITKSTRYTASHAIDAEFFNDRITLDVTINPTQFPGAFSELISELKDVIRHEIEHVAQENLERPESESHEYLPGPISDNYEKYLLLRHEVPAFVRGIYKSAKTQKKTMNAMFGNFFRNFSLELTPEAENRVIAVWTDYAKKHLPNAKWI